MNAKFEQTKTLITMMESMTNALTEFGTIADIRKTLEAYMVFDDDAEQTIRTFGEKIEALFFDITKDDAEKPEPPEDDVPKEAEPPKTEEPKETEVSKQIPNTGDTSVKEVVVHLDDYPNPITVDETGRIWVDGFEMKPFLDTQGYAKVSLPLPGGKSKRVTQHKLVAMAFLGKPPKPTERIVHKNSNPQDCRASNIAWQSDFKIQNPNLDASDAMEICIALIATGFDEAEAVRYLVEHKKRASVSGIRQIKAKEAFSNISDRFFDEKCRVRRVPPCLVGKLDGVKLKYVSDEDVKKGDDKDTRITDGLKKTHNSILKTYELVHEECASVTIYDVYNVKNGGRDKAPQEDIDIVIRCARNGGDDIKSTLLTKCGLEVSDQQIARATRRMR